jgi:hypothetical protein
LVEKNKISKWVGDVRQMGAISLDDQDWINIQYYPPLLKEGIKHMGEIVGDDLFNQMSEEDIVSKVDGLEIVSKYSPKNNDVIHWISKN